MFVKDLWYQLCSFVCARRTDGRRAEGGMVRDQHTSLSAGLSAALKSYSDGVLLLLLSIDEGISESRQGCVLLTNEYYFAGIGGAIMCMHIS